MVLAGPIAVLFSGGDPIAATIIASSSSSPRSAPQPSPSTTLQPRALRPRRRTHPLPHPGVLRHHGHHELRSIPARRTSTPCTCSPSSTRCTNILIMFISHHMVRRRLGYYGQRGIVSTLRPHHPRIPLRRRHRSHRTLAARRLPARRIRLGIQDHRNHHPAVCGTVMGLAYLAGIQIFRVKEANALLAPLTSKLERFCPPLKQHITPNLGSCRLHPLHPTPGPTEDKQVATRTPQTITQPQHPSMPGRI